MVRASMPTASIATGLSPCGFTSARLGFSNPPSALTMIMPLASFAGFPRVFAKACAGMELLAAMAAPIAERAGALLAHIRRQGTLYLRSHVDISPEFGLRHVEALLALRDAWRDRVSLQLVAFPQTGLLSRPGTLELMDTALQLGADAVGGIDPAGFDVASLFRSLTP